jgi:predicted Fe-Mo cluster-binding NifX family protein
MSRKVLIPLYNNEVAPRFDLATDVMTVEYDKTGKVSESVIVLPQASSEDLCALATSGNADVVICGGIGEEYYQYLVWKGISVYDDVTGPVDRIVHELRRGRLSSGTNLYHHPFSA